MRDLTQPENRTAQTSVEAVIVPRRHVVVLALLTCVPLPLLSLAATIAPLPEIAERAAAHLIPFAEPVPVDVENRVVKRPARAKRNADREVARPVATRAPTVVKSSGKQPRTRKKVATRTQTTPKPRTTVGVAGAGAGSDPSPAPESPPSAPPAKAVAADVTAAVAPKKEPKAKKSEPRGNESPPGLEGDQKAESPASNKPEQPPGQDESHEPGAAGKADNPKESGGKP